MAKRSDDDELVYERDGLRLYVTPDSYGESPFAAIEDALRKEFPDLTEFELSFAIATAVPVALPIAHDARRRVAAIRRARTDFPELSAATWEHYVSQIAHSLSAVARVDHRAISRSVHAASKLMSRRRRRLTGRDRRRPRTLCATRRASTGGSARGRSIASSVYRFNRLRLGSRTRSATRSRYRRSRVGSEKGLTFRRSAHWLTTVGQLPVVKRWSHSRIDGFDTGNASGMGSNWRP
jgi:hypothetical protein